MAKLIYDLFSAVNKIKERKNTFTIVLRKIMCIIYKIVMITF